MEKIIGYCGVDCSKCKAYIAKKENNDEIRKKYAEEQSQLFDMPIPPESINCDGCLSDGEHLGYCSICKIKQCCRGKNLENCAFCNDYICEQLEKVYAFMCEVFGKGIGIEAEGKILLDEIRKSRIK